MHFRYNQRYCFYKCPQTGRQMIVIIDYGIGNLRSVQQKLAKAKIEAVISSDVDHIEQADKIIFPGVGAFSAGMKNLASYGLIPELNKKVLEEKTPILGICLGMQLFAASSEEGDIPGLGWINAEVRKFHFTEEMQKYRVPHVGWNTVKAYKNTILLKEIPQDQRFYFTHSYYIHCNDDSEIIASTYYGYDFPSIVQKENIYGVQFHPEKSHRRGIDIIKNFVEYA